MDGHGDEVHVWYGHSDEAASARVFLRRVLARYTGTAPDELDVQRAPCRRCGEAHGKPFLGGHPAVRFNLSHSSTLVAVAVSGRDEVGLDVQLLKTRTRTDALAARFFSPEEREYLRGLAVGSRREAFFRLWARKEACLKATGEGLSGGLSTVKVSGSGDRRSVVRPDGTTWTVVDLDPEPGYLGAVASSEGTWRVVERQATDL